MKTNVFRDRSLRIASDFSIDEKKYLFNKVRELKQAWENKDSKKLDEFRINNSDFGIYEVFLEDSTRTRESFRNASEFHNVKLSMFNADTSSFNKKESYADGFMTLAGYNNRIFIVRSKLEGVCAWLEKIGEKYAERNNLGFKPAFINAGDGKHEHPTQELLDEYTFLEDNDWKTDSIHVALVGDLHHGRTIHSKADGLKIFEKVKVDLIAPKEIGMPEHYIEIMKSNGFQIRIFNSLQEYFAQEDLADKYYFTRPQLERMGEDILRRQDELRDKITFKDEYLKNLPKKSYLYHPLPRHKAQPTIPPSLDELPLNHWEKQSRNGMFMRIVLLSAIAGRIGDDFEGKTVKKREFVEDFIKEISPQQKQKKVLKEGINPLSNGIVIDRFCRGESITDIWSYLFKTMKIMNFFEKKGSIGVGESKKQEGVHKGLIFLPGSERLSESDLKRLAAVTSGCTVNDIENNVVVRKLRLTSPPRIYGLKGTGCTNEACISHYSHNEKAEVEFIKMFNGELECYYCAKPHKFKDIWRTYEKG